MDNRIFCTFSLPDSLDSVVDNIKHTYIVSFGRIFILYAESENEYLITYNVDTLTLSNFPKDTILVHRKKDTNTLYTVNALNELIRKLNRGKLDRAFQVPWQDYRDCLLLTRNGELVRIDTKLYKILSSKV